MNRRQVFYLRIAASLLVMLSMLPVSVALNHEIEAVLGDEIGETDFTSRYNETERMEQEIGLSFDLLTSMLQKPDNDLNPINEIPNSELEEDTFLQLATDGTNTGIEIVGSIIAVLRSNPENPNEMKTALVSLNENMAQLNASLEYPDGMIEAANSTSGEPDSTTPMIGDMFTGVKGMISLLEQF